MIKDLLTPSHKENISKYMYFILKKLRNRILNFTTLISFLKNIIKMYELIYIEMPIQSTDANRPLGPRSDLISRALCN